MSPHLSEEGTERLVVGEREQDAFHDECALHLDALALCRADHLVRSVLFSLRCRGRNVRGLEPGRQLKSEFINFPEGMPEIDRMKALGLREGIAFRSLQNVGREQ